MAVGVWEHGQAYRRRAELAALSALVVPFWALQRPWRARSARKGWVPACPPGPLTTWARGLMLL